MNLVPPELARLCFLLSDATRRGNVSWTVRGETLYCPLPGRTQLSVMVDLSERSLRGVDTIARHAADDPRGFSVRVGVSDADSKAHDWSPWFPAAADAGPAPGPFRTLLHAIAVQRSALDEPLLDALERVNATLSNLSFPRVPIGSLEPDHLPPPDAGALDIAATPEAVTSPEKEPHDRPE